MEKQKTVGIFTGKVPGMNPWDPEIIHSGISGSEEAVIYLSQQLVELGFKVLVFGDPPLKSPHSSEDANPRFVSVDQNIQLSDHLDIAIAWRMPGIGKWLRSVAKKIYLWPHDTLNTPVPSETILEFDGVLWLSEWQRRQWASVSPDFSKFKLIFGNGINPSQFTPVQERRNPYSCIYGSCWNRGLEILLSLWPSIKEAEPRATLDIYYGTKLFAPSFPEKAAKMRKQIDSLQDVHEHGQVGHEELNKAYGSSSFWLYPCTWPETFCISALRAQFAGAIPVVREQCALKETVRHGYKCTSLKEYLPTVLMAFKQAETISLENRQKMGQFILEEWTWQKVASKWKDFFEQ
jgi:glycosyltransferase involved in cell wall biosynthesis